MAVCVVYGFAYGVVGLRVLYLGRDLSVQGVCRGLGCRGSGWGGFLFWC